MNACFTDPKYSADELVGSCLKSRTASSMEQQNFVRVLAESERLQVLPEIRDLFVQLKNEHEGVKEVAIESAFPLDDAGAEAELMTADLEARFQSRLNVSVSVDPELIGGVKISVGDEVIDASVRGKLANMASALKN